jgi:hypothetical protein
MNFGEYFRAPRIRYCSTRAESDCADCGNPMCKKHRTQEGDVFKCGDHQKRLTMEASVKGEVG